MVYFKIYQIFSSEKLEEMYTCKNRFCPFCSWRRSRKLSLQGYKILDAIRQKENLRYIFLTLTVQNPKLEDTRLIISHMNKSFKECHKV